MFCSKCGAKISEGAAFCPSCGQPAPAATSVPIAASTSAGAPIAAEMVTARVPPVYAPPAYVAPIVAPRPYAGFWLRFLAYLIDSILVTIVVGIILGVGVLAVGVGTLQASFRTINPDNPAIPAMIMGWLFVAGIIMFVLAWLYYAGMESSSHQGTLGKMALGLVVTDINDRPVSFGRATGRFFAKIITNYTFLIGYIMAGFTEKKQALHDMIASTLVLRKI